MLDEAVFEFSVSGIKTREQAIRYLAEKLEIKGVVKETYLSNVLSREIIFPTGLQFEGYGVALPHTDTEHVNKSQIAVLTLEEPVNFIQMATTDIVVPVKTIFMLAIKEAHTQVELLQQLVTLLQNREMMEQIERLTNTPESKQELLALLNSQGIY